jgi:hypothetical protein
VRGNAASACENCRSTCQRNVPRDARILGRRICQDHIGPDLENVSALSVAARRLRIGQHGADGIPISWRRILQAFDNDVEFFRPLGKTHSIDVFRRKYTESRSS